MAAKKRRPEEIIGKLHEIEIVPGHGGTAAASVCPVGRQFHDASDSETEKPIQHGARGQSRKSS